MTSVGGRDDAVPGAVHREAGLPESPGDHSPQRRRSRDDGGLGLGTTWTSLLFLAAILAVVAYLAASRRDQAVVSEQEAVLDRA